MQTVADNVEAIQIEDSETSGISSKIQLTLGGDILGTGAKWVVEIDAGSVSHKRLLAAVVGSDKVPEPLRVRAEEVANRIKAEYAMTQTQFD